MTVSYDVGPIQFFLFITNLNFMRVSGKMSYLKYNKEVDSTFMH